MRVANAKHWLSTRVTFEVLNRLTWEEGVVSVWSGLRRCCLEPTAG